MNSPEPLAPAAPPPTWRPPGKNRFQRLLIAVLALGAVIAIAWAWDFPPFAGDIEKTDNAYVRGRTTVMAPQVSGYVVAVDVEDFERVQKGQRLAKIDDRIYRARVEQARATLDAQQSALRNSEQAKASRSAALASQVAGLASAVAQQQRAVADLRRVDELVKDGSVSERERDQTLAAMHQAEATVRQSAAAGESARQDIKTVAVGRDGLEAQVQAAMAQLRLAEIDLDNTEIRAAEAGQLGEIGVRLGQFVSVGTPLLSLVPDERWIVANYKEAQTARMQPGQRVTFSVDALEHAAFRGHVERMAPAAGSEFSVLKPDNATGNFIKVPQRIGVRIAIDEPADTVRRLRPGMSTATRVDTRP